MGWEGISIHRGGEPMWPSFGVYGDGGTWLAEEWNGAKRADLGVYFGSKMFLMDYWEKSRKGKS